MPILPWYGIAQVYSYSVLIYIIIFFSKIEMIRSIIIYYWDIVSSVCGNAVFGFLGKDCNSKSLELND